MTDRDQAQALLEVYREAAGRMAELPLCNPALEVVLPQWREVAGAKVGVLITPWCLNLIWLADDELPPKGESCTLTLDSGEYQGVVAWHERLGRYGSASLVSDMSIFESQEEVESLAAEIAELIFAVPTPDSVQVGADVQSPQRRALFRRMLGADA